MWRLDDLTMLTLAAFLSLWICCVCANNSDTDLKDPGPRWAPQEIRIDDMLRKHFLKSRMKNNFPSEPSEPALRDTEDMEDVGFQYGQQFTKRTFRNMRSEMLQLAKQRLTRQHDKRPADVHPLEVGMGKSTSSMAWDTLAGILADEYTRQENPQPTHELRFIGK